MKRKFLIILFLISIVFVTGCDKKKTLTCTKSEDSTGMSIKTTSTTNFVNDTISTINMNISIKLDSSYVKYADTIKNSLESQYKNYKKEKGVTYNTTVTNDLIDFILIVDNKKVSSDVRKNLKLTGSETYSDNKKTLESDGYTCK